MAQRVAVIGAGPCGLLALKTFVQDGFDAILYERRDHIGGLWKYSDDDYISVADNTEFNSSKYRSAVSDFPMPDDMNDFPTAKQLYQYFYDYCTHLNLWKYIKLGHTVKKMQFLGDADSKSIGSLQALESEKQWRLSISAADLEYTVRFDKVAVATGPWTIPRELKFPGLDKFDGKVVHSMNFHDPASYKGNVLVVGMSASAQDIVSALPGHATKVYLSHRSGIAFIPRYTPNGATFDQGTNLSQTVRLATLFSWSFKRYHEYLDARIQRLSKMAYPDIPPTWNLDPAPSTAVGAPLVAAQLWPHLESGFCEIVPEVAGVCGNTVKLASGGMHGTYRGTLQNIDHIINCTGYDPDVPIEFDPPDAHPYRGEGFKPKYYQNVIPIHPNEDIRNSLALLGHGTIYHSGFVRWEILSWAVSQLWQGKAPMPSLKEMELWHEKRLAWREETIRTYGKKSTFFNLYLPFTDHVCWLDKTAGCGIREHFGLLERWRNLCTWKFWWEERAFYNLCLHGLTSPAIFGLFDTGMRKHWSEAKRQIQLDNVKAKEAAQERLKQLAEDGNSAASVRKGS